MRIANVLDTLTTRSLALRARGLAADSASEAMRGRLVRIFSRGVWPQVQIGWRGGQMQSCASRRKARLTMRSSSEWKEMMATRPPGASRSGMRFV